jgi:hypothetical protein
VRQAIELNVVLGMYCASLGMQFQSEITLHTLELFWQ